ncbi:MAG: DUF5018 domain-containing protein [Bacteroidales bacterium]|jgi:hypothetical protein|nr:DUF5018 domain-containing protein [Bacteroidales bacterium]
MKRTHSSNAPATSGVFPLLRRGLGGGFLILLICFSSCRKKGDDKSAACDIVTFTVDGKPWNISGTNITATYPKATPETALTPVITASAGATVHPSSGTAQNLFAVQGVTYTVTAENGVTTKTYTAKATRAASN